MKLINRWNNRYNELFATEVPGGILFIATIIGMGTEVTTVSQSFVPVDMENVKNQEWFAKFPEAE